MTYQIAIDGPAGAGKSTIAKAVAKKMGYIYVDTGAMYRAMALYLLRRGISADESGKISAASRDADITIAYKDGLQQVLLNGENVTGLLRTEEVGNMASASSVNKDVRLKLVELQRALAERENVVMDGRAKRRYDELTEKGETCDLAAIEADIIERDKRDMEREFAPLRQAEDATYVDSSDMTIDEVITAITDLIH